MAHTKHLIVLLAALCSLGVGCFCLQQKDKEVEVHEAVAVSHNAEATEDPPASSATGTALATASDSTPASPKKKIVVTGAKDLQTFFNNYNAMLTKDNLNKSVLFFCSVNEVTNCHYKVAKQMMIGLISCGEESTISESHPPSFWNQEKYCSREVKKGKHCPTDKVKLLSGVDGLASMFHGPIGMVVYDPDEDVPKKPKTTYFYCRQSSNRELAVRIDFNGGKAAAYRPTGALLGASTLAVLVTTIVGGFW